MTARSSGCADTAGDPSRPDRSVEERERIVRAHVVPEMERSLGEQRSGRSSPGKTPCGVGAIVGAPAAHAVPGDGQPDTEAGVQRLIDAWGQATLAERNAFLWLAAEEIQAAQEGELQRALTTPRAPGNGPSQRAWPATAARTPMLGGQPTDLTAARGEDTAPAPLA